MADEKTIIIRIDPKLLARIDEARGDVPRTVWLRRAAERALDAGQPPKWVIPPGVSVSDQAAAIRIGPVRPKPGSRLKK